ncbi:type I-D CRISPR-associated protein Cas10d/Csc3 [Salinigranum rubrum]|nr:type I-D CRISPR-associated protein Cas10d/Csc3 [Salinigranum rubrum]
MLNHTRNLVFFLHRLATVAEESRIQPISPDELRELIALAVAHDFHKLRAEDENPATRFNITEQEMDAFVADFGLDEFAPNLNVRDFHSCAVDHHDSDAARSTEVTLRWEDYRPLIRLADGMASCTTPQEATNQRMQSTFHEAFPGEPVKLVNHQIDHVTGVFTNLLNATVSEYLNENFDYTCLTIYQDGCVYLAPRDAPEPANDAELADALMRKVGANISDSHPAYRSIDQLQSNIGSGARYSLNDPDFFYAGSARLLRATVRKGMTDGAADDEPTDAARTSMELLEEGLDTEFSMTKQQQGAARFVNAIKSDFVSPLRPDAGGFELIRPTVEAFGFDEALADSLEELPEGVHSNLVSGGKWDYSYALAQRLLDQFGEGEALRESSDEIMETLEERLEGLVETDDQNVGWATVVQQAHAGALAGEVRAFIEENLRVGKGALSDESATTDTFDEYVKKSRAKTCTLCSRGVRAGGNLTPMKSKKSLSTLQAGFTNRKQIGRNKEDKLILCAACRIEFSLRETAAERRQDGRLFFHLVPDYFFTPFSWQLTDRLVNRFTGENRVRLGRLAEAVYDMQTPEGFGAIMDEVTQPEGNGGRTMFESLGRDFDHNLQFGSQTIGYFKVPDNDTEFQFFGAFLALSISAYTGMRVYMSQSPVPEMRAREFPEFAKLGGGFTQVTQFYGESVSLSELPTTLRRAAALIQLGHALQGSSRNDSLFAKYLRVSRNELLPGAHLLKRAIQSSDEGLYIPALMRYAVALDEGRGIARFNDSMSETPHSRITRLAELAFDAIRPNTRGNKPHRVERVFRESVKAVTKTGGQLSREDYTMLVSGRIQKMLDRQAGNGIYPVSHEDSEAGTSLQERIEDYSGFFVDEILFGIANGRPSQLKRLENNLADGFFGATLRLSNEQYQEQHGDDAETETAATADNKEDI